MLKQEFRQKCVERLPALLETLEAQQRIGFLDIVKEDEIWIYLKLNPNSIQIVAEEKILTQPRTTTSSVRVMLTVF
jgi:hypothetical protein